MIIYIIKSSTALLLFFGVYWFLLRKEKLFVFNRFFLLFSILFSFLVPIVSVPVSIPDNDAGVSIVTAINNNHAEIGNAQFRGNSGLIATGKVEQSPYVQTPPGLSDSQILLLLYVLGVILLMFRFISNILLLSVRFRLAEKRSYCGYRMALIVDQVSPFCFLGSIFVNKRDFLSDNIDKQLLRHELEHAKQAHSLDIIFVELVQTLYWFNPVMILYNRAVRINHEYLADNGVIRETSDIKGYADKLLGFISIKKAVPLTSGFNQSLIKKRLIMLTKSGSGSNKKIRIITSVALGLTFFLFLSFKQAVRQPATMTFIPCKVYDTIRFIESDGRYNITTYSEGFYISNEVTNKEYREFTDWTKNNPDGSIFQANDLSGKIRDPKSGGTREVVFHIPKRIDFSSISAELIDSNALYNLDKRFKNYFTDKKYDNYPVVGVSAEMAEYYCLWKTQSEATITIDSTVTGTGMAVSTDYKYRLPSEKEWEYLAIQPLFIKSTVRHGEIQGSDDGDTNHQVILHLDDNVSEWVTSGDSEKGIARGGSWMTEAGIPVRKVHDRGFRDGATGFRIIRYPNPRVTGRWDNFRPEIFPISTKDNSRLPSLYKATGINPGKKTEGVIHYGMDIEAETGTDVMATAGGRVIKAEWADKGSGNLILIGHGHGYESLYSHLKDFTVQRGDSVIKGQTIGHVGVSGTTATPHLHFEIRLNGESIDPDDYLK